MAGAFPHPTHSTSLLGIFVNVELIAYMVSYGLSAAVSASVSDELGASNLEKAKRAMTVALKLSGFVAFVLGLALAIGHNFWAGLFSGNPDDEGGKSWPAMLIWPHIRLAWLFPAFLGSRPSYMLKGCGLD
ncbi:hypothetical protein L3X38_023335 [Prunus dulcis]|uniref:MATE efflux family protein n=1 Tax=Prunus dulcis TaxID=3755 RepID=A0AAD4Z558_PRUDU|nr:hypothetical protein L3X38_023335 [Prunus dulcis]